jgi:hypothetical protein
MREETETGKKVTGKKNHGLSGETEKIIIVAIPFSS